ncbi:glycosyltransferase [Sphingomonas sp. Y38-1Y]|uniref:glycosyltransferase n=1 Tax=Sphingomonas sp. Y38-1Y TaxID=3078265 RepID=UPI0028E9044B|nr:glycosyltransferase [Sphingomonas sp. Y38-1Y]
MEYGGVQVRALEIQKYITQRGGTVDVVFLYKKREISDRINNLKCLIEGKPKNPFNVLVALIKLFRMIRSGRYDCVVGFAHYSSPIATFLGFIAGVPTRIATQTNPPHKSKFAAVPLDKVCGTLGIYTSNIAASRTIADNLQSYPRMYLERLKVINNGIRVMNPSMTKNESRERFGVSDGDVHLVSCGRLSDQKNHKFIVEMMSYLPSHYKLSIVGEGELKDNIQALINRLKLANRINLVGGLNSNDVANFLIGADIFLFPSKYEAFGLAMVEAMAVGIPVVCSSHPALVEVGGSAVVALPIVDPSSWAAAVLKLQKSDTRERYIANGMDQARTFTSDVMSQKFMTEMFGKVLEAEHKLQGGR